MSCICPPPPPPTFLCFCFCHSSPTSIPQILCFCHSSPTSIPQILCFCHSSPTSIPQILCFCHSSPTSIPQILCFCHSSPTSIPQILCFYQISQVCFQNIEWMCFCATSGQYNLWMVSVLVCAPPAGSGKSTHAHWIGSTSPLNLMAAMCCAAWPSSPTLRCCTTQSPWPLQSRRTQSLLRTSQSTLKVPVVSFCRGCLQVKQDAVSAERELVHKSCQEVWGVCVRI